MFLCVKRPWQSVAEDSKILTNHFMSFVAAAGPVLQAVQETPTFKRLMILGKTVGMVVFLDWTWWDSNSKLAWFFEDFSLQNYV